jgi:hypothetical protein
MELIFIILVLIGLVMCMLEMNDNIQKANIKVAYANKQVQQLERLSQQQTIVINILRDRINELEGR